MPFVDLTQPFENGMPGFRMKDKSGNMTEFSARISPFLTHQESLPYYQGNASFEITEVSFQTSIGTYLDAPRHRFEGGADIASLKLETLILDCVVINATFCRPDRPLTRSDLPFIDKPTGKALLIHFGWDKYWGTEGYYSYPYVAGDLVDYLLESRIGLLGVDALNADNKLDLSRPTHTRLLNAGIHIVENLRSIDKVLGKKCRFYAIPLPVKEAAAFPVRAFAEFGE